MLLGGIFLLLAGVLMLCFAGMIYELTESWKSNASGEPSGLYRISTRIGGMACTLVGLAGIITHFVR